MAASGGTDRLDHSQFHRRGGIGVAELGRRAAFQFIAGAAEPAHAVNRNIKNRPFFRVFPVKLKVCLRVPPESWRTLTYPQTATKLWTLHIVLRICEYTTY